MNWQTLCMSCMQSDSGEPVCPSCGAPFDLPPKNMLQLKPRSLLHDQYVIGRALGHGGFGVTYLAWDTALGSRLAVKEYLPNGVAGRASGETKVLAYSESTQQEFDWGLDRFLDEARTLKKFNNQPGIVSIETIFRDNGTAYLVMEFLDGWTLEEFLKRRDGKITFETALRVMLPVIDALSIVHAEGILHRDISPDNIYLTRDGKVKLIDFGAARNALSQKSRNLSIILKEGYAPEEQYRASGIQGPWTDVYATAATLYHSITGRAPQPSLDRLAEDKVKWPRELGIEIDPGAERAIMVGIALKASDRFQSMQDFKSVLTGSATVTQMMRAIKENPAPPPLIVAPTLPPPPPPPAPKPTPTQVSSTPRWIVPAALAVVVLLAVGIAIARRPQPGPADDSTKTSTGASTKTSTTSTNSASTDSTTTSTGTSTGTSTNSSGDTSTADSNSSDQKTGPDTSTGPGGPDTSGKPARSKRSRPDHSNPDTQSNFSPTSTESGPPSRDPDFSTTTSSGAGPKTGSNNGPNSGPNSGPGPGASPAAGIGADYDGLVNRAKAAVSERQYSLALALLTKAAGMDPNKPRAYSGLAEVELYAVNDLSAAAQNSVLAIQHGGEAIFHVRHDHSGDTFAAATTGKLCVSQGAVRYVPDLGSGGFTARRSDIREVRRNKMIGFGIRQKPVDLHPFHIRLASGQNYNFAPSSRSSEGERELIIRLLGER